MYERVAPEHESLVLIIQRLCGEVRDAVRPHVGTAGARDIEGTGASGDATFAIDEVAERRVEDFLREMGEIAYYTEDRGLVVNGYPEYLLVIDPIDGTRPAAAGLATALCWKYPHGIPVFALLAALAAAQRVVSSAHYPSDTAFGAAVGVAVAAACLACSRPRGEAAG